MSISLYSDFYRKDSPERRMDARFVGSLSGCYSLESRKAGQEDLTDVFACRVQAISTKSAVLGCTVSGAVGERVLAKFEDFPILNGAISRLFRDGFVMDFAVDNEERLQLAAKIDWIKKHRFSAKKDLRAHKRVMPPHPHSAVTLPDGRVFRCEVIDVSRSGAAVSAEVTPRIGTRIALGSAVGVVVRHLEAGFALRFDELIDLGDLTPVLEWSLGYTEREMSLPSLEAVLEAEPD